VTSGFAVISVLDLQLSK